MMASQHKGFKVPSEQARRAAISFKGNSRLKRALLEPDCNLFPPIKQPKSGDWLGRYNEMGQTFNTFTRCYKTNLKPKCSVIYLLPIGTFDALRSPSLESLREFASKYFCMEVQLLTPVEIISKSTNAVVLSRESREYTVSARTNSNNLQLCTTKLFPVISNEIKRQKKGIFLFFNQSHILLMTH